MENLRYVSLGNQTETKNTLAKYATWYHTTAGPGMHRKAVVPCSKKGALTLTAFFVQNE